MGPAIPYIFFADREYNIVQYSKTAVSFTWLHSLWVTGII